MAPLGIIAALPAEARCWTSRTTQVAAFAGPRPDSLIRIAGIGRDNATRHAQSLIDAGAAALVSWGTCGGLDPSLRRGVLILPEIVLAADHRAFRVSPAWRADLHIRVAGAVALNCGMLAEAPAPLLDSDSKRALFEQTGAVAADMESAAVAAVAERRGVPFIAVRAILDPADTKLPRFALQAMDASGRLHIGMALTAMLRHPQELGDLLRAAIGLRTAQSTLTRARELAGPRLGLR